MTDAAQAREVGVSRGNLRVVINGERCDVRIGGEIAGGAEALEES